MKKINGKGKILLYSMSALGFNMMNLVLGTYLCNALMVEGFTDNLANNTYASKTLIVAAVWSVIIFVAKVLDGVIDIPLAALTDRLKSRWGRRRPPILVGMVVTILAYLAFLVIPFPTEKSMGNTLYYGLILCLFYASYTLTLVTYYATFSEIVSNERDRLRLSNFKTVFDVVFFVLGYALIPAILDMMNIRVIALICLPVSLTMLIPLFMIKERSTLDGAPKEEAEDEDAVPEKTVGMLESVRYLLGNRPFLIWMLVYSILQFGLQLFLTSQNLYYREVMQLDGMQIMVLMASAFVPVPLTLVIYSRIIKKRGLIAGYRYSLVFFLLAMLAMMCCRAEWMPNVTARMCVAVVGSLMSAFGIGCFFSVNYTVPSAIANMQRKDTGVSHPAMYFAVQGLIEGVATGVSTGIIWVNLRDWADGAHVWSVPIVIVISGLISLALTWLLPQKIRRLGKE